MRRSYLMATVAMVSCGLCVAVAQTTTNNVTTTVTTKGQLQDVVVTASKSKKSVQKTSESISVVTGQALQQTGTVKLDDALRNVPGVEMSGLHNEIVIRGIGTATPGLEPDVSVNNDGVNAGVSANGDGRNSNIASLMDVDRVEVERGPQGTLYGRNADAGVVNIISNEPKLNKYELSATAQFGDYREHGFGMVFNVPVFDQIAIRNAVSKETHDAYIKNPDGTNSTGEDDNLDTLSERARLLYQPYSNLKFLYTFNYYWDASSDGDQVENILVHENHPWVGYPNGYSAGTTSGVNRTTSHQMDIDYSNDYFDIHLLPQYSSDEYACTPSVTLDVVCQPPDTQKSFEGRITNPEGSKIKWTAGVYFVNVGAALSQASEAPPTTFGGLGTAADPGYSGSSAGNPYPFSEYPNAVVYNVDESVEPTTSYAVFGQTTVPVTDKFRVKVGGRYSLDIKKDVYTSYAYGFGQSSPGVFIAPTYNAANNCTNCQVDFFVPAATDQEKYTPFTYLAGVEYDLTPTSMEYAQVSTGFKAGGIDPPPAPASPPPRYAPEKLTAFEVGTKSRFFNNTMQINADAYYYIFRGYQLSLGNIAPFISESGGVTYQTPNQNFFSIFNAGTGTVRGIDFEGIDRLTDADTFTLNVALNDSHYGKLKLNVSIPGPSVAYNMTGKQMANAPFLTIHTGLKHEFDTPYGSFTPSIAEQFESRYLATASTFLQNFPSIPGVFYFDAGYNTTKGNDVYQPAFAKTDLYLNWTSLSGKYTVDVYAKNIFNQWQITNVSPNGDSIAPPFTFGATLGVKFF